MRKILVVIFLGALCSRGSSQGVLTGKIADSASKNPLGLATVTVFKAADTVLLTYRLSTPDGDFKVPGLPFDMNCRVVISFSGYSVFRKEFIITAASPTFNLGTVYMSTDAKSLDEVLVIAERPPVTFRKDTIEFNASAFKTLPNALVEDLLKKLPGVQVDAEGNIMVNGKPVNRILVDGKVFFGDDPKMATRNLPANIIDKVQVTDDKEELLRNGDDNLNNVGKVVNITLKKGVKKGWFGKLYAGGGSDERYEAGGIANMFRDTLQVSLLGYMNNLNKPGFSYGDLMQAGGFQRNRNNTVNNNTSVWTNPSGSGISINGVNFGGAQSYGGISTSKGAGFNLNHAPNTKNSFYAQYFYGNVLIDRQTRTNLHQYNADTIINTNTALTGGVVTHAHNMGIGAKLKPDSVTTIIVNASYTLGMQDEDRISSINTNSNKYGPLSDGNVFQFNDDQVRYYRHVISFTRLSKKKAGRRFSLNHNLDMNNKFNDYTTESAIGFLYPVAFDSTYAQLRKERIPRTDASVVANYSEPLTKRFTLRTGARYEFGRLQNNINTFNRSGTGGKYDVFNPVLSNEFTRTSNRLLATSGIEFKWKDLAVTPYIRALFQSVQNDLVSLSSVIKQRQSDLLPALSVVYKQLNINYGKDITLPYYTYLIPVNDNTNPYFISKGNPSLRPSERHSLSLNYSFNNTKRNLNIGGFASTTFTRNDIVQSITLDDKGIQTTMPVNVNGSRGYFMNFNINKQYKNNQRFLFSWNTGNYLNYSRTKLLFNGEISWQTTANYNHWVGINLNWNDKFEWNTNYSIGYNFTKYTNPAFKKLNIVNHTLGQEVIVRWPKHVIWETQCSYSYNSSIPAGRPKDVIRWNGAVNITMLKDERGILKFSLYDILDQNNNIYAYASRNMETVVQNNVLEQYFMVTFTYNMRAAGASKKVGGRERFFLF